MIGFTANGVSRPAKSGDASVDESIDFRKVREEVLSIESVERRDAYDDYNRTHRGF